MSTLGSAADQVRSATGSVDGVISDLAGVESELGNAISQFQAVGVDDKVGETQAAQDTVESLKGQAVALKDGIEALATQIHAITG